MGPSYRGPTVLWRAQEMENRSFGERYYASKSVLSHGILRKKRSILFLRSTGAQETALGCLLYSGSTPKIDSTRRAAAARVLRFSINHLLCSGSTLLWIYFDLFDVLFRIIVQPVLSTTRSIFSRSPLQ